MRLALHLTALSIYLTLTQSSFYKDENDNVLSILKRSLSHPDGDIIMLDYRKEKKNFAKDVKAALAKKRFVQNMKGQDRKSPEFQDATRIGGSEIKYLKDPVLNTARSGRRRAKLKYSSASKSSDSSSMDTENWKDQWREHWTQKKLEAINSSQPRGDAVNMAAARPWGVACGDPNQHDMPWGSCMLPMECEPEFRIYRGDYFCGRTQFICCALQATSYDLYQGFDGSFEDSDLATDSGERSESHKGQKEKKKRKKARDRKRHRRDRQRRKRKMKQNIRKIAKEIKKILNKSYKNSTNARQKKTKHLKNFIEELKKQYKKDRFAVKDIHTGELLKIDTALQTKLDQIKGMNDNFMKNSTFRDIIVNGTINPTVARMLVRAYPELAEMLNSRRSNTGAGKSSDYLNYDIEYGLLYN